MGCRIAAIAVRIAWIVVPPWGIGGDGLFKQSADVVEQRVLPFVHKDGSGGMEGLNDRDAVMYAALADQFLDRLGQIRFFAELCTRALVRICSCPGPALGLQPGSCDLKRRSSNQMIAPALRDVKYFAL